MALRPGIEIQGGEIILTFPETVGWTRKKIAECGRTACPSCQYNLDTHLEIPVNSRLECKTLPINEKDFVEPDPVSVFIARVSAGVDSQSIGVISGDLETVKENAVCNNLH